MRTIGNLPIPKKVDSKYPFEGAIRNQTPTETGTPVINEIYNDPLMNLYQLLKLTGISPTETEDNDLTQYQIVEALEKFSNKLNDLQQVMTVDALDISVGFNFDLLPENYVFIGKITENILASNSYTLQGSGEVTKSITSNVDILASNLVLVTINSSESTITPLSQSSSLNDTLINSSFGTPIGFNDSNLMMYFASGVVFTDEPKAYDVQNMIRTAISNINLEVVEVILHKGYLLCLTFNPISLEYRVYAFDSSNLSVYHAEITISASSSVDNQPYMYCDNEYLYFTNSTTIVGNQIEDYKIGRFRFIPEDLKIVPVDDFKIHNSFVKTTNVFINGLSSYIYTFISGELYRYDMIGLTRTFLGFFNTLDGSVFKFNNKTYYTNGSVSVKWNL